MYCISFTLGSCAVLVGWLLYRLLHCVIKKNFSIKNEALQFLMLVNLLVIYRMTFHPFAKVDGQVQPLIFDAATAFPFRMNWIPFVHMGDYEIKSEMWLNLIGNCAMFIPTGIIVPLLYPKRKSFKKAVLTGFLISFTIEIIQLPFAVRCSDVDDLILNTAGCIIGYGIFALCRKRDRNHVSL